MPVHVTGMTGALAMLCALFADHFLGEPPARLHPVVWMGNALTLTGAPWQKAGPARAFTAGALAWLIGAVLSAGVAWLAVAGIGLAIGASSVAGMLARAALLGLLLKPLLAWRMLRDEVLAVEFALECSVDAGRTQLRRLVSRDTSRLTATEVRESALESLAENLNDSLVAPLFWFAIGGLPAAALYRFANTADAMWGYHGSWEWAGKWAARADDLLSYVPARVAAALLSLGAWQWPSRLRQIAQVTPSPNGGWPMGMLALALNVRLSKPGVYVLNASGDPVRAHHLKAGLRTCERAAWLTAVLMIGLTLMVARWL